MAQKRKLGYTINDIISPNQLEDVWDASSPSTTDVAGSGSSSEIPGGGMAGAVTLYGGYLQSENFVHNTSGWQLTPDSAEFNVGVSVDELHIPDEVTANSFHVDTTGNAWWGCTPANFVSNNDNATAYVLKTGNAKFQNVTLTGSVIVQDLQAGTDLSLMEFSHDIEFTPISDDEVAWSAGTITMSNGVTFTIKGGGYSAGIESSSINVDLNATSPDVAKLDATHVVVVQDDNGTANGVLNIFAISGGYGISTTTTFTFHSSEVRTPVVTRIDNTHFAVSFREESSSDGSIKIYSVDGSYNVTEQESFVYDSTNGGESRDMILLDSSHLMLAYTVTSGSSYVSVYAFDGSYQITLTTSHTIAGSTLHDISIGMFSSSAFAIAARVATTNYTITKTFSIDGSYNITEEDSSTLTAYNGAKPRCLVLDATHYVVAHNEYTNSGIWVRTFSIDGSYTISAIDSLKVLSIGGSQTIGFDIFKIDVNNIVLAYGAGVAPYYLKSMSLSINNIYEIAVVDSATVGDQGAASVEVVSYDSTHYIATDTSTANDIDVRVIGQTFFSTGSITAATVVYFDSAVSTTELQSSSLMSDAVGANKILIGYTQAATDPTSTAQFIPTRGVGGLTVNEDQIFVPNLAAIVADLGAITAGTITLDSSGYIRGGQTAYNTGTGFFLGYSSSAYKFSIGDGTNKLTWDGTKMVIDGAFVVKQPIETYSPSSGGTATLDLSLSNDHRVTLTSTGGCTVALSNVSTGQRFLVSITQSSSGSGAVTWFSTIRWADGAAPTLSTGASKRDTFGFICTGTNTYDGFILGMNI